MAIVEHRDDAANIADLVGDGDQAVQHEFSAAEADEPVVGEEDAEWGGWLGHERGAYENWRRVRKATIG